MTLLARGAGLRNLAAAGFAKSAELEARENQTAAAIDQAKKAQEMNTLGTGAGFGAMYGMKGLGAAKAATAGQSLGAVSSGAAGAGNLASVNTEALTSLSSEPVVASTVPSSGTAVGTTGATTGTTAGTAGSTTGTVVGTTTGTTGASAMSALSTIAAPVAIGLGVAYLLNKLFD